MAKLSVVKGATSVLTRIFVQDSTSTTGAGKTGLTNTSFTGTKVYVARDDDGNAGGTSVSLTAATRGTWSSGGIVEKDATNMPGVYEFGLTNASLVTGSRSCLYEFIGTGIAAFTRSERKAERPSLAILSLDPERRQAVRRKGLQT